ncbi:MAG: AAA family ATPase [Victivallales bacterium]|nr:AAA family ATPase [Victivallales bacterium]
MVKETETVIDMHNRISASQLEKILRMQLKTLAEHPELAHVLPPLMVWGAPGLGKSSIIRSIAEELGIKFIDVRLAQREPVDVRGLPVPDRENKKVDWMVSGEWPRDGRGILLFDELTAADRSLQVAAYELILDRRLGDLYKVPDGWYICAAGNRVEDAAVSTTMSSALANRFMHVELGEDVDAWAHWANQHNIHPSVTGFLRFRPECLFRQNDENLERGWPTPRAWERVSIMMNIVPADDEELLRKLVYGLVGNRAGMEFIEFHKLNASFDDVRSMMLNPSVPVTIPQKVDRKYALCAAMAYYLWRGKDKAEAEALLNGFFRICTKLSSDFACMVMIDVMTGCGQLSSKEAASRLFYHKDYKTWAEIHGKAMKKHLSF